jgi:hypothetical protein
MFFHEERAMSVREMAGPTPCLDALREQGQMTWSQHADGWNGKPEEIFRALGTDGFQECKREMTTSRRDCHPVGGVWQGVNPHTKSVASVVWVAHSALQPAMVFLEIDGETMANPRSEPDADEERG